ncbi:hypothetical protein EFA69_16230 [Rufibacter immobilis]|uniref:Uncharacterized protein n=1 Tax=Rufibacter immobilis TaxID=1348778 RepID=A0A3M9MR24_9BACT|nr:hypothetical protein [Rufibacter immobilis]RNI27665.1 hypothetical protein EFA69_16230 [Rufibacter immobilis]
MTTKEAFVWLAGQRNVHKELGYTAENWKSMKKRFKSGELSTEKIEEALKLAGFEVVQEKQWALKS